MGYWSNGARCDQIRDSLPGVGFALVEGVTEPVRLRIGHHTDERIAELVKAYAPSPPTAPTDTRTLEEVGA